MEVHPPRKCVIFRKDYIGIMSKPVSRDPVSGSFVSLDPVEFQNGYAIFVQYLLGKLPVDPTFPTTAMDLCSGKEIPLPDLPSTRAAYAASKRFTDPDKRASFTFRLQMLMPLAMERKYEKYRNDAGRWMHVALITAVAAAPCTPRMTPSALGASLDETFRLALPLVEGWHTKH